VIRRIFHSETKQLSRAAMIIAAASLVSRIVGLVRDRLLASQFGAGETLDIYYAAFRIPDFVFTLLILGALSAGFIPLFTKQFAKNKKEAWAFADGVLSYFLVVFVLVCVVLIGTAPQLVDLIAPGFHEEARAMTVQLTRIMLISPLLLGVSSVLGGVLHSMRRFLVTALAPIAYNVGIIFGILVLAPLFGVAGLAYGVVVGALLHACVQLPTAVRLGFRPHLRLRWTPTLTRLTLLSLPRVATLGLTHLVLIALTAFATQMAVGSLAVFTFANNLYGVPIGVFGVSYAVAAFPAMSRAIAAKRIAQFTQHFSNSIRQVLFFLIPATALYVVLKAQLVRLVLGAGAFDWADTVATIETLEAFSLGIVFHGATLVLVRAYWARENTLTPAIIAGVGALTTIASAWWFRDALGVRGLALAFSLGFVVQTVFLWAGLVLARAELDTRRIVVSTARMVLAAFLAALAAQWIKTTIGIALGTETVVAVFTQGVVAGVVALALYGVILWILGSPEIRLLVIKIDKRLRPRPEQLELIDEM
jgi:putative peptidoglycan lipid II flippase